MNFSDRTAWDLSENSLTALLRQRRQSGLEVLDLTMSNPGACGLGLPAATVLQALGSGAALTYSPDPLGARPAREAVQEYYHSHGAELPLEQLCLTSSTSEAYSCLFRLLCNQGDEVLIARPSYPLFDFLAQLDDVRLVEYPLLYDHGWHIDLAALERAITPRTRAVIVVHPNNPTGNFASHSEQAALDELCATRSLALLADEVFLDYSLHGPSQSTFAALQPRALTFVLSGLSKVCALPQMKLSWIAATGPEPLVTAAMARLEVIADTFLSVNSPAQAALPGWLAAREPLQGSIRARLAANLRLLDRATQGTLATRLELQAGWTAMLRVPRTADGLPFAEAALHRGVLVQPGEFYGASAGHIVFSLLTPPDILAHGLESLPLR